MRTGEHRVTVTKGDLVTLAARLLQIATPLLNEVAPNDLRTLRLDLDRLTREAAAPPEFRVCLLGNAAVGKSTLINAIVEPRTRLLPEGGAGPLTAAETRVTASEQPQLTAEYVPASTVQSWLASLDDDRRQSSNPGEATARGAQAKRLMHLAFCGQLHGSQTNEYLSAAARLVLGQPSQAPTVLSDSDAARVRRARARLSNRHHRSDVTADHHAFLSDIAEHASGALAPLVRTLTIGWPSRALFPGMMLVDLPGLGVATDAYQAITRKYLADDASIVILVVDRSGIVDEVASALQNAGFFRRLLLSATEHHDSLGVLTVAVVKLDLVASDAWRLDRAQSWSSHLLRVSQRAIEVVRAQLSSQFEVAAQQLLEGVQERHERIDRALAAVHTLPVLPTEFQRLAACDHEHPPLATGPAETGVPDLVERLHLTFRQAADLDDQQFLARVEDFQGRVTAAVQRHLRVQTPN